MWSPAPGFQDVQAQQEKRLSDLEAQVRNDLATRREIQDLKADTASRFDRLQDLLNPFSLPIAATKSATEHPPPRHGEKSGMEVTG